MKLISIAVFFVLLISCKKDQTVSNDPNIISIDRHLSKIIETEDYRNYQNPEILNQVSRYIFEQFLVNADTVYYQPFVVNDVTYRNVVAVFGSRFKETLVVGAHYDVFENQDGADDNASGTVGLLEIARRIQSEKLTYRLELVAYTLEEPPFFRTEQMGSFIHARSLKNENRDVIGMMSLEMIGYFSDAANSQDYPEQLKALSYGDRGNYILLVHTINDKQFGPNLSKVMSNYQNNMIKTLAAPTSITGVDFSDHLNYWNHQYNAVMFTNTAFYRNKNYHTKNDTKDKLDLPKMNQFIQQLVYTLEYYNSVIVKN